MSNGSPTDWDSATDWERGFTESTIGMIEIWESYRAEYGGNAAKMAEAMDIFFLGCQARMMGYSLDEVRTAMTIGQEASEILN